MVRAQVFVKLSWEIIIIYNMIDAVASAGEDRKMKRCRRFWSLKKTLRMEFGLKNVY